MSISVTPTAAERAKGRVVVDMVFDELIRAIGKHAPMNSPHEGHSVIREELDKELWEHVCSDTGRTRAAAKEAIQIAAMAVRYVVDLCECPQCDGTGIDMSGGGHMVCGCER